MSSSGNDGPRSLTAEEAESPCKQLVPFKASQKEPSAGAQSDEVAPKPGSATTLKYGKAKPPVYLKFTEEELAAERKEMENKREAYMIQQKIIRGDIARAKAREDAWAQKLDYEKYLVYAPKGFLFQQPCASGFQSHTVYRQGNCVEFQSAIIIDGKLRGCYFCIPSLFDAYLYPVVSQHYAGLPRPPLPRPVGYEYRDKKFGQQLSTSDLPDSMRRGLPQSVTDRLEPYLNNFSDNGFPAQSADSRSFTSSQDVRCQDNFSRDAGFQSQSTGPYKHKYPTAFVANGSYSYAVRCSSRFLDPSHPEFVPQSQLSVYPDFSRPQNTNDEAEQATTDSAAMQEQSVDNVPQHGYDQSLVPYYASGDHETSQDYAGHDNTDPLDYSHDSEDNQAHYQGYNPMGQVPVYGSNGGEHEASAHGSDNQHQAGVYPYNVQASFEPSRGYSVASHQRSAHNSGSDVQYTLQEQNLAAAHAVMQFQIAAQQEIAAWQAQQAIAAHDDNAAEATISYQSDQQETTDQNQDAFGRTSELTSEMTSERTSLVLHVPVPQRPIPAIRIQHFNTDHEAQTPPQLQLPYGMGPPQHPHPPSPPQTARNMQNQAPMPENTFWHNGVLYNHQGQYQQQHQPTHQDFHHGQQTQMPHQPQKFEAEASEHQGPWMAHTDIHGTADMPHSHAHMAGANPDVMFDGNFSGEPGRFPLSNVRSTQNHFAPDVPLYAHYRDNKASSSAYVPGSSVEGDCEGDCEGEGESEDERWVHPGNTTSASEFERRLETRFTRGFSNGKRNQRRLRINTGIPPWQHQGQGQHQLPQHQPQLFQEQLSEQQMQRQQAIAEANDGFWTRLTSGQTIFIPIRTRQPGTQTVHSHL